MNEKEIEEKIKEEFKRLEELKKLSSELKDSINDMKTNDPLGYIESFGDVHDKMEILIDGLKQIEQLDIDKAKEEIISLLSIRSLLLVGE